MDNVLFFGGQSGSGQQPWYTEQMTAEGKTAAIGCVSLLAFLGSIGCLVILGAFGTWDLRFHEDWHWAGLEWFLVAQVCGWIAGIKSRSTFIGKISILLGAISLGVLFFIFLPGDARMMAGGHSPHRDRP